ncbi:MAG TPA: DUF302 domain-containing protein [Levilactobacillus hammesii]|uniref:DUF302 domain-containing protein n=1 Tax=Levilactobacillus hammesii TaxID=267633 RepID=A0A921JX30_9LACO|nr:DUF302 domain-containing protein [Levilactobacillus hammesii]
MIIPSKAYDIIKFCRTPLGTSALSTASQVSTFCPFVVIFR